MKNFFFLTAALLCTVMTFAKDITESQEISLEKVLAYAQRHFEERDVDYYYLYNENDTTWSIFIDADPMANWEHECYVMTCPRYIPNGQVFETQSWEFKMHRMPPKGDYKPLLVSHKAYTKAANITPKPLRSTTNHVISKDQEIIGERTFAIILSGGVNPQNNFHRYWNDCSFIYQTLVNKYAVPKSHIYPIMAGVSASSFDPYTVFMNCSNDPYNPFLVPQPRDLDGDGENETIRTANKQNIQAALNAIAQEIKEDDHLFFFVTDHGAIVQNSSVINLWGENEYLYDFELASMLAPFTSKYVSVNVVMGQCNAGGFVNKLCLNGCIVATASSAMEPSHASPDYMYDEFLYHWTSAMNGSTPDGTKVNADKNGDGIVSTQEAFEYARANDCYANGNNKAKETPQYLSTPAIFGQDLAFNYLPPAANNIIIQDNEGDIGLMPNITTDRDWYSPDVWARNEDDGDDYYQHLYYTPDHTEAWMCIRVHNRGRKKITSNFWLHPHWMLANKDYTPFVGYHYDSNTNEIIGAHLTPIKIPEIAPGKSVVLKTKWELPGHIINKSSTGQTFCMFAKITDNPDNSYSIDGTRFYDILASRLQAQRSVLIQPYRIKSSATLLDDKLTQGIEYVNTRSASNVTVHLRLEPDEDCKLIITSLATNTICKTTTINHGNQYVEINAEDMQAGIYAITLISNGVIIDTHKFSKF